MQLEQNQSMYFFYIAYRHFQIGFDYGLRYEIMTFYDSVDDGGVHQKMLDDSEWMEQNVKYLKNHQ